MTSNVRLMSTANAHERIPAFTIGDRLRKAREKAGLDQEHFAQEVGISRGTVSNYERAVDTEGLKRPYLAAWAMRADVPMEWILLGETPDGPGNVSDNGGFSDTPGYTLSRVA